MPLLKEIPVQDGLLVLWKITEKVDELFASNDSIKDLHLLKELKNEKRQKEWLAVRKLLIHIGCDPVEVCYNKQKQPTIKHPIYKHISISHSGEIAGILLHKTAAVGLDIETLNRDFIRVENKYLSEPEKELATKTSNGHALFWCAKEAVYKAAGRAGIHFAKQIRLERNESEEWNARLMLDNETRKYLLHSFEIEDQLVVYLIDNQN